MNQEDQPIVAHLEALRSALTSCLIATAIIYPIAYWLSPHTIDFLIKICIPANVGKLHFFAPMEVFWTELNLSLILALVLAYPWNIYQLWKFLLPALYQKEAKALKLWILASSALFAAGVAFSLYFILPILMGFSGSFASDGITPIIGLQNFLSLAGWLMLAFGIMFQTPILVVLAVRFGIITPESLEEKRPYVVVAIFILAAILTPPDVISQLLLSLPTYGLFEVGVWIAKRIKS